MVLRGDGYLRHFWVRCKDDGTKALLSEIQINPVTMEIIPERSATDQAIPQETKDDR